MLNKSLEILKRSYNFVELKDFQRFLTKKKNSFPEIVKTSFSVLINFIVKLILFYYKSITSMLSLYFLLTSIISYIPVHFKLVN